MPDGGMLRAGMCPGVDPSGINLFFVALAHLHAALKKLPARSHFRALGAHKENGLVDYSAYRTFRTLH